jgi:hypothetical protein
MLEQFVRWTDYAYGQNFIALLPPQVAPALIDRDNIQQRAKEIGEYLKGRLIELQENIKRQERQATIDSLTELPLRDGFFRRFDTRSGCGEWPNRRHPRRGGTARFSRSIGGKGGRAHPGPPFALSLTVYVP